MVAERRTGPVGALPVEADREAVIAQITLVSPRSRPHLQVEAAGWDLRKTQTGMIDQQPHLSSDHIGEL